MILTGQETQEDFQAFIEEVEGILSIRAEKGANTSVRCTFTPLVFYSQIALRHLPRITAENSYNAVRSLTWVIEQLKERGVRCKVNGRGVGTYFEQLTLDFGPAGTDWLVHLVEKGLNGTKGYSKQDTANSDEYLKEHGYDKFFFTEARPKDWIFPSDHIFYATQQVKDEWWRRTEAMNFDTRLCLKTLANPNPKCHGCKMCDPKHIPYMLKRPLDEKVSVDEVLASLSETRTNNITRILVQKNPGYEFVHSRHLAHFISSRFLQREDALVDSFYKVGDVSNLSVTTKGQKDYFGGTFYFDVHWMQATPYGSLDKYIEDINKELKSAKVKLIHYNVGEGKASNKQSIGYFGIIDNYSLGKLKEKVMGFDWNVKVPVKAMGMGLTLEKKPMPELKDKLLLIPYKDKIMYYCHLPEGVNPLIFLGTIMNKGYQWCLENIQCQIVTHTQPVDAVCKCGQELTFNRYKNTTDNICPMCQGRVILKQMSSR